MCQPELGSPGSELHSDNPERICYTSNKFPGNTWYAEPAWFLTPVCSILRRERLSLAWLKRCLTDITSRALTWPVQVDNTSQRQSKAALGALVGLKSRGGPLGRGWCGAGGPRKGPGLTYNDTTGADQSDLFLQGYSAPSRASLGLRAGVRSAVRVVLRGVVSLSGSLFHLSP